MQKGNVRPLNNTFTRAHQQGAPKRQATVRAVHIKRIKWLLLLMATIILLGAFSIVRSQLAISQTNEAVVGAKADLKKINANKDALKVQVDQLHNDDYMAKLIREKYLQSKPGEMIFNLPDAVNKIPDLDDAR